MFKKFQEKCACVLIIKDNLKKIFSRVSSKQQLLTMSGREAKHIVSRVFFVVVKFP